MVDIPPCAATEIRKGWRALVVAGLYFCFFFPPHITPFTQTAAQPITDSANLLREQEQLRTKGQTRN